MVTVTYRLKTIVAVAYLVLLAYPARSAQTTNKKCFTAGKFDMAQFPDVYNFFSDMGIRPPPVAKITQSTHHVFSNTKPTATAQQRRVELEDIPLPPLPVLHPKDSETPFRPKISQTQFANNEWATGDETAASEEKATPAVGRAQKFHDSAGSNTTEQVTRESILQNRRSTFMMDDAPAVAEVDAWLTRTQAKSSGSCADEHCQTEDKQKKSSSADCSVNLSTASVVSKSNNYGGNYSYAVRTSHFLSAECERALCYMHPDGTKIGQYGCHGVRLVKNDDCASTVITDLEMQKQLERNVSTIQQLRYDFEGSQQSQLVLDYIWKIHAEYGADSTVSVHLLPWRMSGKVLCHMCWAAAAGFLTSPNMERKKECMANAVKTYYQGRKVIMERPHITEPKGTKGGKLNHAVAYLNSYVDKKSCNAQQLTTDSNQHIQGISEKELYLDYIEGLKQSEPGVVKPTASSLSTFRRARLYMNEEPTMPTIAFNKWSAQQECAVCSALKIMKQRAAASHNQQRVDLLIERFKMHRLIAQLERMSMDIHEEKGKKKLDEVSGGGDGFCSFKSSNFMHHGHSMSDWKAVAGMGSAEGYSFKTTAIVFHGWGYLLYVADPRVAVNANYNVHVLHLSLHALFKKVKEDPDANWPTVFHFQIDGASDNKARVLFMYMEYLVRTNVFDVIYVNFLIVGHTHNFIDQRFVAITKQLRREVVKCLQDYLDSVARSYTDPNCKPTEVIVVDFVPDYTKWLVVDCGDKFEGFALRTPDELRPHQFVFKVTHVSTEPDTCFVNQTRGCKLDYKNLTIDGAPWNEGQGTICLLWKLPDTPKPPMQNPSKGHA